MNLPNKLTLLRIILIPVFMVVLYWGFPGGMWYTVRDTIKKGGYIYDYGE